MISFPVCGENIRQIFNPKRPTGRLAVVASLVVAFYFWFIFLRTGSHPFQSSLRSGSTTSTSNYTTHFKADHDPAIHFLLPATTGNGDLCKAILSAAILGYNSPVLLGWGWEPDRTAKHGGTHALKIYKTIEYLNSLDKSQDNDLVLLVDAFDVHFQLPPETVIARYKRMIKESDARLRSELGDATVDKVGIRNTIFFGAEKKRWPRLLDEVGSFTYPESPIPLDVFGKLTDTPIGVDEYSSRRQRYLNSGVIIGPVGDLKKMFERVGARSEADEQLAKQDSDQGIYADLMGEQNYMREVARLKHVPWYRKIFGNKPRSTMIDLIYVDNILDPSFDHMPFHPEPSTNYEFGIALDYFGELSHQTKFSAIWKESDWITYSQRNKTFETIKDAQTYRNCKLRIPQVLPDDISSLPKPFSTLSGENAIDSHGRKWDDVPLYTQYCLGTLPVVIHHNGNKGLRSTTWKKMWFASHTKDLFQARIDATTGMGTVEWSAFRKRPTMVMAGGAWTGDGTWLEWPSLCPKEQYGKALFNSNDANNWI